MAEPNLTQLQEQAFKEIKEMELKKHSDDLLTFLSFKDLYKHQKSHEEVKKGCSNIKLLDKQLYWEQIEKIPIFNFYPRPSRPLNVKKPKKGANSYDFSFGPGSHQEHQTN
jgi:hypothetical protein